jgi:hypothetical protein
MKGLLITAAILAALFLGLLTLVMLGFSTGPVGMLVGIVLAVLPLPIYMLLALWIDRFEKSPSGCSLPPFSGARLRRCSSPSS